jgi:hypothetical protein
VDPTGKTSSYPPFGTVKVWERPPSQRHKTLYRKKKKRDRAELMANRSPMEETQAETPQGPKVDINPWNKS